MANTIHLMDLKQIITLKQSGFSERKIAKTINVSRNTVSKYLKLFKASRYTLDELLVLEDAKLAELFSSKTTIDNKRFSDLMEYFTQSQLDKSATGFTLDFHYQEYRSNVSKPYSYTQFVEHFNRRFKKIKPSLIQEHLPGEKLMVDFAGKKLEYVDIKTGEVKYAEVLVVTWPFSMYTYVEALKDQKKESLILALINALHFFGGSPKVMIPDNLKSAVTKPSKYEPEINSTFKAFAVHYGFAINPTRSYSPQDKALVEKSVELVYQRIYYPMRNMLFTSLQDLNNEIKQRLDGYNNLLYKRRNASRKELFQAHELPLLKALPQTKYEIVNQRKAKVQKTGYVYFSVDKTYYSVPYQYIGKSTVIRYTESFVEITHNLERIASHHRQRAFGKYISKKSHLCSSHKEYLDWSPEYFQKKAQAIGEHVRRVVEKIISRAEYPEIAYKTCLGILSLKKHYDNQRLNQACEYAMSVEIYSLNRIRNILKSNIDQQSLFDLLQDEDDANTHIPKHNNVRGKATYK